MTLAKRWLVRFGYGLTIATGILGVIEYPGSKIVFSFFCLVIFAIAAIAVRFPNQYAHFFLGIAWFLGFWVKYVFHQTTGAPYDSEPFGLFDGTNVSWDAVFVVISIGGAGYLAGRLVALPIVAPVTNSLLKRTIDVPAWWPSYRNLLWSIAGIAVLSVLAANEEFSLLVRGYVAKFVLPWPLGGLFAWLTDIGLALLLALLLAWDRQMQFGALRGFVALCIEGALFSVSTLSRGIYFFHTLPPVVTEGTRFAAGGKRRLLMSLFAVWLVLGVAIPPMTTALRLFGQRALPVTQSELAAGKASQTRRDGSYENLVYLRNLFIRISQLLLIDRWIGLEGVMATVAYSEKNPALLAEAAAQRRSYGTVDVYTRKISGSRLQRRECKNLSLCEFGWAHRVFLFFRLAWFGICWNGIHLYSDVRDRTLLAMACA